MEKKFMQLVNKLEHADNIFIQPHNIPDPDSIASSMGLRHLLKQYNIEAKIVYFNPIEKANSKKMLEIFNIDMTRKSSSVSYGEKDYIILIDSQLGQSNVTELGVYNIMVIDHHEYLGGKNYINMDIRPDVGACSSIISQYYYLNDMTPPVNVATSLLYGIIMDTDNLTRRASALDIKMFYWLYNQSNINHIKLLKLNQIEKADLLAYAKALDDIEIYAYIGFVHIENCNDSLLGTISDMVNTIEGVNIVIAYAMRTDGVKFSIRSGNKIVKANELVRYIISDKGVGGGHKEMAGGFMPSENMDFLKDKELDTYVRHRVISYVEMKDASI